MKYFFKFSIAIVSLLLISCTEVTPENADLEQGNIIADKQALITFFVPKREWM